MQLPSIHVVSIKLNEKQRLCVVVSFYFIKIKMTHHCMFRLSLNLQRTSVRIRLIVDGGLVSIDGFVKSSSQQSQEKVVTDSPELK